jgi:hypothetical protein
MKKTWISGAIIVTIIGVWTSKTLRKKPSPKQVNSIAQMDVHSFWTCPMHPQIHTDHSGECPICHMKLIQVKAQAAQEAAKGQTESRTIVQATNDQLNLLGIQRYEVEKMDLKVRIPVSGRFTSSSAVVFQIYESDLRYIKPGLSFKGESSFFSEEEVLGVISSVDSIVDPTSQTVRVVGQVRKGPKGIASETGFRGDIELDLKGRVAIPESSVLHTGGGDLVYLFTDGNRLTAKAIKLGLKSEGFFDVLEGVEVGQVISSGPNFLIDSESKIRAASLPQGDSGSDPNKPSSPSCPNDQHWDIPMSMCMPGRAKQ